jgi:hypothetical protein
MKKMRQNTQLSRRVARFGGATLCLLTLSTPAGAADLKQAVARDGLSVLRAEVKAKRARWIVRTPPKGPDGLPAIYMVGGAAEEDETLYDDLASRAAARAATEADWLPGGPLSADSELGRVDNLPEHFDWRSIGGLSYMPPVATAQGKCGACVSFAVVAVLEAQLNIACNAAGKSFDLSRQHFFSCGGGSCKTGWKLSNAVQTLTERGVPDTPCLPYLAADGQDIGCEAACSDHDDRAVRGIAAARPTVGIIDVQKIKQALLKGPLVSNIILFEDLEFYGGGVYRHVSGNQLGSHAIVLVGWDDADKAWIARNSWGDAWGEQGYFRIAWDDVSLPGRYTWLLDVSLARLNGICSEPR